jgi:site-specific recombinase XerD
VEVPESQLKEFELWLRKRGRTQATAETYVKKVSDAYRNHQDPMEKLIDDDLAPKYRHLIRASLKAWFRFQGNHKLEEELLEVRIPPSVRQGLKTPLTVEEWRALRKEIDEGKWIRNEAMRAELGMLACRGFRVADVLRLKREEVELAMKSGVLRYLGKGRKQLEFTVAPVWKPYLECLADHDEEWNRVEDLICPNSKPSAKRASATRKVERTLIRCGQQAGIDKELYPHLLRHTYATRYYEACQDPAKLQKHMQWGDISVAMGYVDAGNREDLDAIADSLFDD